MPSRISRPRSAFALAEECRENLQLSVQVTRGVHRVVPLRGAVLERRVLVGVGLTDAGVAEPLAPTVHATRGHHVPLRDRRAESLHLSQVRRHARAPLEGSQRPDEDVLHAVL